MVNYTPVAIAGVRGAERGKLTFKPSWGMKVNLSSYEAGVLAFEGKAYSQALHQFLKFIQTHQNDKRVKESLKYLVVIYQEMEKYEESNSALNWLLKFDLSKEEAIFRKYQISLNYFILNKFDESIRILKTLDPADKNLSVDILLLLYLNYKQLGSRKARKYKRKLLKTDLSFKRFL